VAGEGARAPAEDAVDHDEEVVRRVGGDGVAPDVDAAGDGLLGAHRRRAVLVAAHGRRPPRCRCRCRWGQGEREAGSPCPWRGVENWESGNVRGRKDGRTDGSVASASSERAFVDCDGARPAKAGRRGSESDPTESPRRTQVPPWFRTQLPVLRNRGSNPANQATCHRKLPKGALWQSGRVVRKVAGDEARCEVSPCWCRQGWGPPHRHRNGRLLLLDEATRQDGEEDAAARKPPPGWAWATRRRRAGLGLIRLR